VVPLAADFPFFEVLWLLMIFSVWLVVISFVVMVLFDNFRRHDHSGWAKAGWTLFVIVFPLLGAIVYQIARPRTAPTGEEWDASRPTAARDEATRIGMGLPR
jgi:hypothetical protein